MPEVGKYTLARSSPAGFAWVASDGAWIVAPHLRLLSEKIVEVATGRCPRLIVTMPPRHGKSELISKYTPAWFLGNFPNKKVMLASYADTFAASWGRKSRDLLDEWGPRVFGVRLNPDSKGGQQWELASCKGKRVDGVMVTAGVGGGLTGKGAHLMIIDDPVKNSEEAQSERIRETHHDWWKSTARTRLQKGAGVILVMTRWHEDDLAGRLLMDELEGGDKWEVLNLPAICETDSDVLGREQGEVLWPEMFDKPWMEQTRRAMGLYWFSAMYQQRPAPAEGMLFKRDNFRYYTRSDATETSYVTLYHKDKAPETIDVAYCAKFTTVDVAASEKQQADYTVAATWLVTPNRDLILWDMERAQFEGPAVMQMLRNVYHQHKPAIMGIERLGAGYQIIQELVREGLPVVRLEPDKDKITRALPACARYEEGRVFHPKGVQWLDVLETELLTFPNAAHDDCVDVVAYAALQLPNVSGGAHRHRNLEPSGQRAKQKTITGGLLKRNF